jgi:hypothetical protein
MVYIILDTNIWLYLANGQNLGNDITNVGVHHFELLSELIDKQDDGYIKIIVNEIIVEEWTRNKVNAEGLIIKLKNKIEQVGKNESDYNQFINNEDKLILNAGLNKVKEGLELLVAENIKHIDNVELFLKNACQSTSISEKAKLAACELSLRKNAPFHNNKNNMADAVILLSGIDYLKRVLEKDDKAYFVSNNTKDFCEAQSKNKFHPDIIDLVKPTDLNFTNNLNEVITVSREVQNELETIEYLQSDYYLSTLQFDCQTPACIKRGYSFGYLTESVIVAQEFDFSAALNQLILFNDNTLEPKIKIVKSGYCQTCGSKHIVCPKCKGFIYDADTYYDVECRLCQTTFSLLYNDDGDLELTIKNAHKDGNIDQPV